MVSPSKSKEGTRSDSSSGRHRVEDEGVRKTVKNSEVSLGSVAHASNPGAWEAEEEDLCAFKAIPVSSSYTVRPCWGYGEAGREREREEETSSYTSERLSAPPQITTEGLSKA